MAYNFYPQYYSPIAPMQYPQQQKVEPIQPQIQNGGFVSVRNENEARAYPVALGNSITFKDESAPYIYTKTMGFSQLETPRFEKYRLIKEEAQISPQSDESTETNKVLGNELKARFDAIWGEIEVIKSDIETLRNIPAQTENDAAEKKRTKKEVKDDDAKSE